MKKEKPLKGWRWAKNAKECVGRTVGTHNREYQCIEEVDGYLRCISHDKVQWRLFWTTIMVEKVDDL